MTTSHLAPTGVATEAMLDLELAEPGPAGHMTAPGSRGEHELQRAYGDQERAARFYSDQLLDQLNPRMIEFVERMEMAFVATADARGDADCSLRAGQPGFIRVLDPQRITYPEYRGNGVHASLGNISENPRVGLMLLDFVHDLIGLHINGDASIIEHADMLEEHPELSIPYERGTIPQRWVVVDVREAYLHCRKHIPRMEPVARQRVWSTDDMRRKGGDYFGVRADRRA